MSGKNQKNYKTVRDATMNWLVLLLLAITLALLRLIHILPATRYKSIDNDVDDYPFLQGVHKIMILLGSGGHTGEMLRILQQLDAQFLLALQRRYLISSGDNTSLLKLKDFETTALHNNTAVNYIVLPRARNVGEPISTSIKNSIVSLLVTLKILVILALKSELPDILLINGPGTAATLSYLIVILKFFGMCHTRIIYIESLARVQHLSITGKLVRPIADRFVVQWGQLRSGRAECYGILV